MNDFKVIKKLITNNKTRLFIIFSFTFCLMLTTLFIFIFLVEPEYQSTSQILIGKSSLTISQLEKENSPIDSQMVEGYAAFMKSTQVLEKVKQEINFTKSISELQKQVHISHTKNSPVLTITSSSDVKNESEKIANTLAYVFKQEVKASLNKDNISIISLALSEGESIKPSQRNIVIGTAITTILAFTLSTLLVFGINRLKKVMSRREIEKRKKDLRLQTVFK